MIIGFTGTDHGMTASQRKAVQMLLERYNPTGVVHGDCVGADAEFHQLALRMGVPTITLRPGVDYAGQSPKRMHCDTAFPAPPGIKVVVLGAEPYLMRNDKITGDALRMIAAPLEFKEQERSGTWSTCRYALKRDKIVDVVYPDGQVRPFRR